MACWCCGVAAALALVTALACDTAHLAQLAVAPSLRRSGMARLLLADTIKAAHRAGFTGWLGSE